MAVTARFRLNPALEAELARSPQMMAVLAAAASRGADEAKQIARREAYDTGAYHDGIRAGSGMQDGRPQARIIGSVFYSHFVERGGLHTPPKHILSRGAQAAGLRIGGSR